MMKKSSFPQTLLMLALFALIFSNCRNEPEFVDPVNFLGKWNASSYTIDDVQQLGTTYETVSLNFGEIMNGIGPFALITESGNGSSSSLGGEYSLSTNFETVYITLNGVTIAYDAKFNENYLRLLGSNEDNQAVQFDCEKDQ